MTRISFAIVMSCNGLDTFIAGLIVRRRARTTLLLAVSFGDTEKKTAGAMGPGR
jgi:hypothetical protein